MGFRITRTSRACAGFTLPEVLVATGLSCLIIAAMLSFYLYGNRSFAFLTNHVFMEQQNQFAMDCLSKQIRQAKKLTAYSTNSLTFTDYDGQSLQFTFDPNAQTLSRIKQGQTSTLLTGCSSLQFFIYGDNVQSNLFDVSTPITDPTQCKVVTVAWTCSQGLLQMTNSEPMQCAKVLIRNASGN